MLVCKYIQELNGKLNRPRIVVACGVFDGVHRGHQSILQALRKLAAATDAVPAVLTFEPHPRAVLFPDEAPQRLTSPAQKRHLLAGYGAKAIIELPFSKDIAALPPEEFLERFLLDDELKLTGICVGENWRFGRFGKGDTKLLRHFSVNHGFQVVGVPDFLLYGKPVSSTRTRSALSKGRLSIVKRLLGRNYAVCGEVCHGRGIGSVRFNCPTANLTEQNILLPPNGVYVAAARLAETGAAGFAGKGLPGIVYIGTSPTLKNQNQAAVLELHLFDFNADIYGQQVEVQLIRFIRPEIKFPSEDALQRQIQQDLASARSMFSSMV